MSEELTAIPEAIGPYRLLEVLGEGGMGSVYRAVQSEPVQREVALKVIKLGMDTKEVVARFESERQALAVMDHTSIAKVLDAGATEEGRPYFVMELVRGIPINEYCDTHKLGTRERLELFIQVCEAVQHAHQKGVIHRDLKPSNVLVSVQDDRPVAKVIDFGIAKAVGSSMTDKTLVTAIGQILGTPAYMSPEQAERSGLDVDTRTDLYSLGVMLYEILSGSLPFDRDALRQPDFVLKYLLREKPVPTPSSRLSSLAETQETVARNRATDIRTLRRELSGDLDWIVVRAMEKDRTRRYASATELGADLRRFLASEPVIARPPSAGYRFRKFATRNRGPLAAGLLITAALVGGATAATVGFVRADRSADQAALDAARAEAANDFLERMLRAASPATGEGPNVTVVEVLDAASVEVDGGALEDQPLVEANVRRAIGGTYMHLGVYDQARAHFEAARPLLEENGGSAIERMHVLRELGQTSRRQADPAGAEPFYREALAIADSSGLATDGEVGETLTNGVRNDLGLALRDMDRIDEAADVLEALAESERRILEGDDVNLATTLNNLALVKRQQGDIDGAINLFEETMDVLGAAFGEQHVYIAAVLESIGSLEQRQGRLESAADYMGRAMAMRREILGERHPDIVNGLNGLGLLYLDMGDLDQAEASLAEGLAMSIELLGPTHTRTAALHNTTGLLHMRRNNPVAAEESFRSAVAIREAALGDRHRFTLNSMSSLAGALYLQDRPAEAETLARRTVTLFESAGIVDALLVGAAHRTWGQSLAALDRFDDAEVQLLAAYEMQAEGLGDDHVHTRRSAGALVDLYDETGRDDEADEWRPRSDR